MTETIPYIIQEDGFYYVAYKEKVKVPETVVSSKGVANGLSEDFNDGWDFGPDSYDPNSTAKIPYTETSGTQEACEYSYSINGYTHIKIIGSVLSISNTVYLHSNSYVFIEGEFAEDQSVLSTIEQNSPVPVFQNYSNETSPSMHIFRNLVFNLNIGTNTTKVLYFVGSNILSIYLDHVRFNTNNTGTAGNYSLYNDSAFLRVYMNNVGLGNSNDFDLYTVHSGIFPSLLEIYGGGYVGDIVASVRFVNIGDVNMYGNLTLTDTGTQPSSVVIHDVKYAPQTTLSATSMITVNSNLYSLTLRSIQYSVYQDLTDLIQFTGTSTTSITIDKVLIDDIPFIVYPPSTSTYSINLYSMTYATINELRANMVRALSSEITLTGVADILPSPTLSANPPVSGTVYQNTNPFDIEIDLPAYATTAATAGYVTVAKGATSTPTGIGNQYVSGSTSSASTDIIRLRVPAGWYYSFTASGVTFGTASVFAE